MFFFLGGVSGGSAVAADYSASNPAPNDDLIVPGVRIGPVYIGMSDAELYRVMGEPTDIRPIAGSQDFYCFGEQSSKGCDGILTYVIDGTVNHVDANGDLGSKYHTSTQQPLAIGSSDLAVRAAFGEPQDCNRDTIVAHYLYYEGIAFSLSPQNGKVVGIEVGSAGC